MQSQLSKKAKLIIFLREHSGIDYLHDDTYNTRWINLAFCTYLPFVIWAGVSCEDEQQRLYFFANDQLWQYSPTSSFEQMKLPDNFKPHSVFPDGTYIGKLQDKLVLVSADGKLLFTSDFLLNDNFYKILGNRNEFWVWQYDGVCNVFENISGWDYKTALFPIQQENEMNFSLLCFDEKQNHVWNSKGSKTYLFDANENQSSVQRSFLLFCFLKIKNTII